MRIKRLFIATTFLATLTSSIAYGHPNDVSKTEEKVLGDANSDGSVNAADIVEIVNYIMGKPFEKFDADAADTNRDGTINVADIVLITAHIMGTINLNTESGINVSITDWNKDSKDNGGTAK